MIYNAASVSGDPADDSVLVKVALDGSSEEEIVVPLLAHDFVEHPDGTYLFNKMTREEKQAVFNTA